MSGLRIGSLFSGYCGLDRAAEEAFGATTAWVSDIDPGACKILAHRHPDLPNHGDITKIDWNAVEPVDILTGGFPCQDVSHAGKRAGLRPDTRSGLWSQMAYAVSVLRPRYVIAENVRGLLSAKAHGDLESCEGCVGGPGDGEPVLRALGAVLGDLAELGYDSRVHGLRAADVGAPHNRFRVFVLATDTTREPGSVGHGDDVRARRGTLGRGTDAGRGAAADAQGDGRDERRAEPARLLGGPDAAERGSSDVLSCANCGAGPLGGDHWSLAAWCAHGVHAYCIVCEGRGRQFNADPCSDAALADADRDGQHRLEEQDSLAGTEREGGSHGDDAHGLGLAARGLRRSEVQWGAYEPAIRRWERVLGRVAPAPTETSPKGSQRLSPRFVEWLMGLPAGWVTDVPGLNRNAQLKALGNGVVSQQAHAAITYMLNAERAAA